MKHLLNFILTFSMVLLISSCHNGSSVAASSVEKSFKVWGNCEKCKARIEKAAELPGVSSVSWNEDTNQLVFKIDTAVANPYAVLKAVAEAGYDNERFTASAEKYAELPECCQYERKPKE